MALVALLKGVNVGGHRSFRPSALAKALEEFDVVNIGAAGTFIVRRPVARARLRAEIRRRLPFEASVMMCGGEEILRLVSEDPLAGYASSSRIIPFVSLLETRRTLPSPLPMDVPAQADWCIRVLYARGRFLAGIHRREMRAIRHFGQLENLIGTALTTRSWSTILAIAERLQT